MNLGNLHLAGCLGIVCVTAVMVACSSATLVRAHGTAPQERAAADDWALTVAETFASRLRSGGPPGDDLRASIVTLRLARIEVDGRVRALTMVGFSGSDSVRLAAETMVDEFVDEGPNTPRLPAPTAEIRQHVQRYGLVVRLDGAAVVGSLQTPCAWTR